MAKKARTSRPRRAAAPADGFAAPPQEMDIEEEEPAAAAPRKAPLVPLEHVIAKCPRAELEDLILASVKNNEPVTREDLEAAAARHAPPPKAVIELGNEREGTGAFDAIDTQCLGAILEQLPTSDRLTLASVVCKSWRRLRMAERGSGRRSASTRSRSSCAANIHGGTQPIWPPIAGVLRPHSRERGPGRLRTVAAAQLLDWIVDKDGVFELGVDTSDGALSAELASAAIKGFPNLRALSLDGKQIFARTLRTRYPCQSKLKTLVVGRSVLAGVKGALASFLGACTSLETLCAPAELATFEVLEAAATAWKEARGGAAPLLAHLKLYGYAGYNSTPSRRRRPPGAGLEIWRRSRSRLAARPGCGGGLDPRADVRQDEPPQEPPRRAAVAGLGPSHLDDGARAAAAPAAGGGPESGAPLGAGRPPVAPRRGGGAELPRLADTLATLPPSLKKLELMDVALEHQNLETHSLAKEGSVFVRNCDWLDGDAETTPDSKKLPAHTKPRGASTSTCCRGRRTRTRTRRRRRTTTTTRRRRRRLG